MKVLVVSEPGVDGVFRHVESLCHFLIERGVQVHLAYSDCRGSDRLPILVRWIEEHGGETVNLHVSNRPSARDLSALLSLARLVRRIKPHVIHSHSSKAGALARSLRFLGIKTPQLYSPHAYIGMRPNPGRLDWFYNKIEGWLGRTASTIVTSTTERKFAQQKLGISPERVFYVPNGSDMDKFSPVSAEAKTQLRETLGLPIGRPILGFIGRSSAQKDPLTLYRAFIQAARDHPIVLFHVGRGELDPELNQLVENSGLNARIFRTPYMATPADFYRVVDGFILTSRYEGFSIAALEALAADLPLIMSQAPGNTDLLTRPLSHAWSAPVGDADGFAIAIKEWYDRLLHPTPCNHREIACKYYSLQDKLLKILSLYSELTGVPRPAATISPADAPLAK